MSANVVVGFIPLLDCAPLAAAAEAQIDGFCVGELQRRS